ncbi:hypothetical protein [Curtobacterium sp. PhB172]|uniref:hypothetical protein n=1 Tax=Curtobacterium sp. PhB172 TaxID=2485196 RepID=UPI001622985D|nr:hypothetical protein [Curtobacterium sp. PhB172]
MLPTPSIDGLAALLKVISATGLRATLQTEGTSEQVPMAVGVDVYQVTQEAVTNTLKHASASNVTGTSPAVRVPVVSH